ncbi:MAG TPA: hypothetical protein VF657_20800 [Actinoplanes sp.]
MPTSNGDWYATGNRCAADGVDEPSTAAEFQSSHPVVTEHD